MATTTPAVRQLLAGVRTLLVLTAVLGLGYPLAITGVSQLAFAANANGSLLSRDGVVVGSALIGQSFAGQRRYFQSRPSAAGDGYDALASSASNLGPENPELVKAVRQRRDAVARFEGVAPSAVPPDAVTASGSGLDPQISPAYAALQVPRVARERGLPAPAVSRLVAAHTTGRALGFLGEPAVDVLALNLALDGLRR